MTSVVDPRETIFSWSFVSRDGEGVGKGVRSKHEGDGCGWEAIDY